MTLGDRVKARRHKLGLSQYDVARLAHIRRPTITELETNRRMTVSSEILKRLAQALGCTTDYLVGMYEKDDGAQGDDEPADLPALAVVGS